MKFIQPAIILSMTLALLVEPQIASAQISVGISIGIAPPALPVYVQPAVPVPGYLWTPGYWAYANSGYYWVPGVWVAPPRPNVLWTPGYWAYSGGGYGWRAGYWGPHVGYYGGINYGFGYTGVGFYGGRWGGGVFRYNTAYANVNTAIVHNTYINRTYVNNTTINRYSYNGPGGVATQPTIRERTFANEQHYAATSNQLAHERAQARNPAQFAATNHGVPATTALNEVNGRRYDQQGRIANGVTSGALTAGETRNLELRQRNLNQTIGADRRLNGGTLTPQERAQVNARQNTLSHSIYNDKHNAATMHYGDTAAGQRRYNQQQRIAGGVRSGQLSPGEAAANERRQQNINRSIANDRARNGGHLNAAQRQNINQRQNHASHQIYQQKHNAPHAPR